MKTLTVEQRKNRSTWFISRILSAMLLVLIFQEPGLLAATGARQDCSNLVAEERDAMAFRVYCDVLWP